MLTMSSSMYSTNLNVITITLSVCSRMVSMLKSDATYRQFSRYYDELTYDMPYALWLDIIHQFKDGRRSLLDIGCGTGNLSGMLEYEDICAFDQSEHMVAEAREKGPEHIGYFTDDMRYFELDRTRSEERRVGNGWGWGCAR